MKYEQPIIETIVFQDEGIITTSGLEDATWNPNVGNENLDGSGI